MKKGFLRWTIMILICICSLTMVGCGNFLEDDKQPTQTGDGGSDIVDPLAIFQGEYIEIDSDRLVQIVSYISNSEMGNAIDCTKYGAKIDYSIEVLETRNFSKIFSLNAQAKAKKQNNKIVMSFSGNGDIGSINKLNSYLYNGVFYNNILRENNTNVNRETFEMVENTPLALNGAINICIDNIALQKREFEPICSFTDMCVQVTNNYSERQEDIVLYKEKVFECKEQDNNKVKVEITVVYTDITSTLEFVYVFDKNYNFMAHYYKQVDTTEGYSANSTWSVLPYSGVVEIPSEVKDIINNYLN